MDRTSLPRRVATLAIVAVLACGWLRTAAAQYQPPASPPQTKVFKAYRLRCVSSHFAFETLRNLLDEDERASIRMSDGNGTLLVSAPPEMHKKIDEVLKTIDVARPAASDTEIKIFTLVNAEPLPAANMLCDLLPKETHVAVDHRTRSVVVSGPRDALEIAAAVLQRLDAGGKGERPKLPANYEVQVEWFANDGKGAAPAADLKDVVAELARLGIKDPRQIGRLTVQTSSAHSFRLVSSPVFAGRRAKLTASGILSATNEAAVTMEIAINATEVGYTATGQVEHNLSEISTRIAMPQGQYVVLATAPVTTSAGDITSVFVVRVSARPAPGIRQ